MPLLANPFTVPGDWFRGNLHVHTTNSDGAMPPHKLVAHYAYAGWDFIALTDHWRVSELPPPDAFTQDITVIPGIEVSTANGSTEAGTTYHIVGINMQAPIPRNDELKGPRAAQWYVDAIREQGGEAHIAHAYWSGLTLRDVEAVRGHYAIEVYNTDTEVHIGRGNSQMLWDDLLTHGVYTRAVAVDDSHRPGQDSLRAWTVVRAADRSASAIMAALRAGHFYASNGPEIYDVQLALEGDGESVPYTGKIVVRCSPARSIALVADPTRGNRLNAGPFGMSLRAKRLRPTGQGPQGVLEGELLTGCEFTLTGLERYVRVQVEDAQGRCAWTNPLFMRGVDVSRL
jgi:hypothetical protein